MQRGYKIFAVSGLLFASSISIFFVWGISFSNLFINNNNSNLSTNHLLLFPKQTHISKVFVNSTDKLLTLVIESQNAHQILLSQSIEGPDGSIVSNSTFKKPFFFVIKPKTTGEYKNLIRNLDSKETANIYIFFGNVPFLKENGEFDFSVFIGFIIGLALFIGGLIFLAIGIIIFLRDRNKWKYSCNIPR